MCMDPVTLGIGMALSGAGGLISANDASSRALGEMNARNAALKGSLDKIDANAAQNRGTFNGLVPTFGREAQDAALGNAQATRAGGITANMGGPESADTFGFAGSAPSAVRGELAKRLKSQFETATAKAKAQGNLSSYGDVSTGNNIAIGQAGGDINTVNNMSKGQIGITQALTDLAAAGAYKQPSMLGPLLQFGGSILGGAAGKGLGMGGSNYIDVSKIWNPVWGGA